MEERKRKKEGRKEGRKEKEIWTSLRRNDGAEFDLEACSRH
jgi:hypothetical protein